MKFTVTLKYWFPDGTVRWATRLIIEAPCASDALLKAEMALTDDKDFDGCKLVDYRVSEYERNDEYRFISDTERWELEEKTKVAPAEIARALNEISDKMGCSCPAPQPQLNAGKRPFYEWVPLINAALLLLTVIVLLLKEILR